jgi:fatty-acyl-CoA synthase
VSESPAKAWLRALEMTAPIPHAPERILPSVIEERASEAGENVALMSDGQCLTYSALQRRINQYSRWALDRGLEKDQVVCILMPNGPEYLAAWLGITKVGGVAALLNTNLTGPQLAHCVNIVAPRHVIVDAAFADRWSPAPPDLVVAPEIWSGLTLDQYGQEALGATERRRVTIDDRALCIYTSGTTGLPKAANVSHARVMHWSHWFCGMMGANARDRMFSCLPMYHSVGGVLAPGAMLVAGASLAIGEKFSASAFWSDVVRWRCTLIQYIGELCRYLLDTPPSPMDTAHQIRMACGNGLAPDIWNKFQERFGIPRILEFYAATEGGVSLFNVEGESGAIGRVPPYLVHRFSPVLVKFDDRSELPVRNGDGFCIRCAPGETGEAIGRAHNAGPDTGSRFEGYTDSKASEERVLRNVFEPGDRWVRTGDLMRQDSRGFFYFVDRIGDTFRWKGENVATTEVSEAILAFPGITHANVYGVAVPFHEGRAGMAALVADGTLDLEAFHRYLTDCLPRYARPRFLRISRELETTGTYKYSKLDLLRAGYDPAATSDPVYFDDPERNAFVPLDEALLRRVRSGSVRV